MASLSLCPVMTDDRRVGIVAVVQDISEQRLTQTMLGEAEARLREGEALAHVGRWLWDVATGAVQWSDEFHRIHGVDPLEFDGTFEAHVGFVHPDDRERVLAALEYSVVSGRAFDEEYRLVRPNGELRRILSRAEPTMDSAGEVVGLRGIGQDVTDRSIDS
jgi:PAS domain S-box-containing protein